MTQKRVICLSIALTLYSCMSVCLYVRLSVRLSVCLYVCMSLILSVRAKMWGFIGYGEDLRQKNTIGSFRKPINPLFFMRFSFDLFSKIKAHKPKMFRPS